MKISIVIPTYEANGKGKQFLKELLNSINNQSYKDVEIIVSDHSQDSVIEELCNESNMNIIHFYNSTLRGNSSANMNEGIKKATGDFIKIMHLDDIFCDNTAIEKMVSAIEKDNSIKWGAFGFNHNYESQKTIKRNIVPSSYRNERMSNSALIGCPSVSFFLNDKTNFFDEKMIIVNDFDMHYRLEKKYGSPYIIPDISITIRIHGEQVTNSLSTYKEKESEEMNYFKTKVK